MNVNKSRLSSVPLDEWAASMAIAVDEIDRTGRELLARHRRVSERAEETCVNWRLEERQADQREALESLLAAGEQVLEKLIAAEQSLEAMSIGAAADTLESRLPVVEAAFLAVRHCAQDLLQWAERHGSGEQDELRAEYRALHGKLTAYAPVFKPRLEAFQLRLAEQAGSSDSSPAVSRLLSAITRYNAVLDAARRFVAAVVAPPLELVFAETEVFLRDIRTFPVDTRGAVGSELNDCCQSVLYEPDVFANAVAPVSMAQPAGIDSSLVCFESRGVHILMTVEEDPLFGQMTVHLLRAVGENEYESACAEVAEALAEEWR